MKFLFCVQTIFEMDNPWLYVNYLTYFRKYILQILNYCPDSHCAILMGEAASYRYAELSTMPEIETIVVTQEEMLNFGKFDHRDVLQSYFRYCHERDKEPEYMEYHVNLLRKKLKFVPDFIISRDNAPYLEKLFPEALTLYTEVGFISRNPFQQTMYFDALGMNCGSYLYKNWQYIEHEIEWSSEKELFVSQIKSSVRAIFMEKNPYIDIFSAWRKRYKKIFLLPLQFSGFSNIDAEIRHRSQLDIILYVMDRVPSNIGIAVTVHPDYNVLSTKHLEFLRKKYKNLLYDITFIKYNSSSQFILGLVDGVINITSTIGLQSLFWDIPCIQLGAYFAHYMARCFSAENLNYGLTESELLRNNKILYWMFTRYIILPKYYQNGKWLVDYFIHIKENLSTEHINDIYVQIDSEEDILKNFVDGLNDNIPECRSQSKAEKYYHILLKSSERYFKRKKLYDRLGDREILIYGKGSLGYLAELEIMADERMKKLYKGTIDSYTYKEYPYTGRELILVTPVQDFDRIKKDLSIVTESQCISIEDVLL